MMHQPIYVEDCIEFYAAMDSGNTPINNYVITDTILNPNCETCDEHALTAKLMTMRLILFIQIHAVMNHPEIGAQLEKAAYVQMGGPCH